MKELVIDHEKMGDAILVHLRGTLDSATREVLKDAAVSRPSGMSAIIDLSELAYVDSTGLGSLITILKNYREAELDLILAAPSQVTRQILDITMLSRIVPVTDTCEEAAALLKSRGSDG